MNRDTAFAVGENYHLFNRGAHKARIFVDEADYERFMLLLFLANDASALLDFRALANKYKGRSLVETYEGEERKKDLVEVLAFSLMPNHFHLVVREKTEGGIVRFMRRVMTAYSMYFNLRHGHSGVLFQGRFKSRHVSDESYFRWIFAYVHLNPVELVCPDWETVGISDADAVRDFMRAYAYSSFGDYRGQLRAHTRIISPDAAPDFLATQDDLEDLLSTFTKDRPLYV